MRHIVDRLATAHARFPPAIDSTRCQRVTRHSSVTAPMGSRSSVIDSNLAIDETPG